jgi:hypothetical protein
MFQRQEVGRLVPLRPRPDGLVFWASGEEASISLHDGKKAVCHLK